MSKPLTDEQKEALVELVEHPGWHLLWRIVGDGMDVAARTMVGCVKNGDTLGANLAAGKLEGVFGVAFEAYENAGIGREKIPARILRARDLLLPTGEEHGRPD